LPLDPGPIDRLALSPDGRRIALSMRRDENTDIWIADEPRGVVSRLTVEPTIETQPVWTPDGARVTFRSEREGPGIWWRSSDGSDDAERLTTTRGPIHSPYSWTSDGKTLLLAVFHSYRHQQIASVTPPDATVRVLLAGEFAQLDPQASPDGRWLAYQSDESGRFEVYVRPFPDVQASRWQVSTQGGMAPRWNPRGGEILYFTGAGLSVVRVQTDGRFSMGPPTALFDLDPAGSRLGPDYGVAPDGERFLFSRSVGAPDGAAPPHIVYVQHALGERFTEPGRGR
jgi:Tol biopolymer transport system component